MGVLEVLLAKQTHPFFLHHRTAANRLLEVDYVAALQARSSSDLVLTQNLLQRVKENDCGNAASAEPALPKLPCLVSPCADRF